MTHTPCHRKRRYDTKVDAQAALVRVRQERADDGRPPDTVEATFYRCPTCLGWHLTASPLRVAQALDVAVAALLQIRAHPENGRILAKLALDQIGAA